mgnify:CR=1 FL=1
MSDLVVGLGEVGGPLRDLLQAEGHDLNCPTRYTGHIDTLHIAFPYGPQFIDWVQRYQTAWAPTLTIVHSTVPIGTTRKLIEAVHSPVNGRQGQMREDLLWVPKWIGGTHAKEAQQVLELGGMRCLTTLKPETTEAMKLLCLAKYAAANALARLGQELGIPDHMVMEWDRGYNTNVEKGLQRPLIQPDGPTIGGHCLMAGVALLRQTYPHPLLDGILRYSNQGPSAPWEAYLRGV